MESSQPIIKGTAGYTAPSMKRRLDGMLGTPVVVTLRDGTELQGHLVAVFDHEYVVEGPEGPILDPYVFEVADVLQIIQTA